MSFPVCSVLLTRKRIRYHHGRKAQCDEVNRDFSLTSHVFSLNMTVLSLSFPPQKPNRWMAIIWHHLAFLLLADSLLLNSKALEYRPYVLFTFVCLQLSLSLLHNRCSITVCWTELSFLKTSLYNWLRWFMFILQKDFLSWFPLTSIMPFTIQHALPSDQKM